MHPPEALQRRSISSALPDLARGPRAPLRLLPNSAPETRREEAAKAKSTSLPDRYRVSREGESEVLRCVEAPTLRICIQRGKSVTANAARNQPEGTIFLDGAAQGEPFMDPGRAVYNLDHHEGCVRAFTLATCEQAMVLVRKRLDLGRRDWRIHANDADLDAVLAIWVLLNHLRLAEDEDVRRAILPLLRLEGAIDAWGLEYQDLCGFPPELHRRAERQMKALLNRERAARAKGDWDNSSLADFVAGQLRLIDQLIYTADDFEDALEVEELARRELPGGGIVVVCRASSGIYEVEQQLRRFHGDRLGIVALQKDPATYSLRQVDPCLPVGLDRVYARLNLTDPASGGAGSGDRWGGSSEIGGSPRTSGTRLSPEQIGAACAEAHGFSSRQRRRSVVGACLASCLLVPAVMLAAFPLRESMLGPAALGVTLFGLAGTALVAWGHRRPGLFGLRRPQGRGGSLLLVGALAVGALAHFAGAGSLPISLTPRAWVGVAAACVGWELLFRGWVQGQLAAGFAVQEAGGAAFLSQPTLWAALLSAAWAGSFAAWLGVSPLAFAGLAFALGLVAGFARERSESVIWAVGVCGAGWSALHAVAWWS